MGRTEGLSEMPYDSPGSFEWRNDGDSFLWSSTVCQALKRIGRESLGASVVAWRPQFVLLRVAIQAESPRERMDRPQFS